MKVNLSKKLAAGKQQHGNGSPGGPVLAGARVTPSDTVIAEIPHQFKLQTELQSISSLWVHLSELEFRFFFQFSRLESHTHAKC
jgi:hypothetical protein